MRSPKQIVQDRRPFLIPAKAGGQAGSPVIPAATPPVISAKAGIQASVPPVDPRFRGDDNTAVQPISDRVLEHRWMALIVGVLMVSLLMACTLIPKASSGSDAVRIGSKNFTEQLILGQMYAQLLESRGIKVERYLNQGDTMTVHGELTSGKIDLYPEYTGTALLAILNLKTMSDPQATYDLVARQYRDRFKLVWLDPAPMNNSQALAVKRNLSQGRKLTTISQMVSDASQFTLAAVPDFIEREDGLLLLKRSYGPFNFKGIEVFDPASKYKGFLEGQADVVLAFGTDGEINGYDLVLLKDDRGAWPPYNPAPVVRQEVLAKYPKLAESLNSLAPLLTSEVMQSLNWRVDGPERQSPARVAEDFLKRSGLSK